MRSQRARDLLGFTLFLALAAYAGLTAAGYGLWTLGEPGSGLFPVMISVAMGVAALVGIVLVLRRPGAMASDGERRDSRRVALYIPALAFFAVGLQPLGHVATTAGTFLFLLLVVERVGWRRALWVTVGSVAGSYLLFERLLGVPLPRGIVW